MGGAGAPSQQQKQTFQWKRDPPTLAPLGRIPSTKRGLPLTYPSGTRPTSASNYTMPIQHRIICRLIELMSREQLTSGESSVRALPKTAKFLHAY